MARLSSFPLPNLRSPSETLLFGGKKKAKTSPVSIRNRKIPGTFYGYQPLSLEPCQSSCGFAFICDPACSSKSDRLLGTVTNIWPSFCSYPTLVSVLVLRYWTFIGNFSSHTFCRYWHSLRVVTRFVSDGLVVTFRRTVVSRINSQSFASFGCPVSLQSLQHLQTGLLKGTRCFGKLNPTSVSRPSAQVSFPRACQNSCVWILIGFAVSPEISVSVKDSVDTLPLQFDPDFQTPLILDESLDFSDPEESRLAYPFSDGLLAKSEPILSMSAFQKPSQTALLGRSIRQVSLCWELHEDTVADPW